MLREKVLCFATLILLCVFSLSIAAEFQGVEYDIPSGWKAEPMDGALGFVPNNVTPELGTVMVLAPAEQLANKSFDIWLQEKIKQELQDGSKLLKESDIQKVE